MFMSILLCLGCLCLACTHNEKMYKDDNATGNTLHFNLMILVYTQDKLK